MTREEFETIKGYNIYKGGTWCEVTKDGEHVFDGSCEEDMTCQEIYKQVTAQVVFSYKDKELVSYSRLHEFSGERKSTIAILALENNCDVNDITVTIKYDSVA